MLPASAQRILAELAETDLVLDIGGWAMPFKRADWVMDLEPWETRGDPDPARERFTRETWIERDICDRAPYPFADNSVDFVICSHTLEDVRDPVWVCSEIVRIGKRGYIEVPSRLDEQSFGFQGPWTGWSHHRWLIDVGNASITFVHKPHTLNRKGDHFPGEFHGTLSPEERVQPLWWESAFAFGERIFDSAEGLDDYTAGFVREQLARRGFRRPLLPLRLLRRIYN